MKNEYLDILKATITVIVIGTVIMVALVIGVYIAKSVLITLSLT